MTNISNLEEENNLTKCLLLRENNAISHPSVVLENVKITILCFKCPQNSI